MPLHNTAVTVAHGILGALLVTVVIPSPLLAQQACISPPSGIIAWWPFDETSGSVAADIAGGRPGSRFGGATATAGKVGGAIRLNGTDAYLAVADGDGWAFGTRDFTIEFWVNFGAGGGNDIGHPRQVFIANDEGPFAVNKWFFALGGGYLNFHVNGPGLPGAGFFPLAPFNPVLNEWYHLAITRSSNLFTIYVNGAPAASETRAVSIPNANAALTMGQAELLALMNGSLDEMTIYDRSLTAAEIQRVFAAGSAGKCKPADLTRRTVAPSRGGDTGPVSVRISAGGFAAGAAVKLSRAGRADVPGTPVYVTDGGATILTTFDLTGKDRGLWDVVVTNPNGAATKFENAFTIEEGRAGKFWADVVGRAAVRPARANRYHLVFGNLGNMDIPAVNVWIDVMARDALLSALFPARVDTLTPISSGRFVPAVHGPNSSFIPVTIVNIPPGLVGSLQFDVTIPGTGPFQISITTVAP